MNLPMMGGAKSLTTISYGLVFPSSTCRGGKDACMFDEDNDDNNCNDDGKLHLCRGNSGIVNR